MLTARASAGVFPASKSERSPSGKRGNDCLLCPPHRRSTSLLSLGMIVSEDVEHSVDDEPQRFFFHADTLSLRICPGNIRTNVDVSDDRRASCGVFQRERYHVGRSALPQILSVEFRDNAC